MMPSYEDVGVMWIWWRHMKMMTSREDEETATTKVHTIDGRWNLSLKTWTSEMEKKIQTYRLRKKYSVSRI